MIYIYIWYCMRKYECKYVYFNLCNLNVTILLILLIFFNFAKLKIFKCNISACHGRRQLDKSQLYKFKPIAIATAIGHIYKLFYNQLDKSRFVQMLQLQLAKNRINAAVIKSPGQANYKWKININRHQGNWTEKSIAARATENQSPPGQLNWKLIAARATELKINRRQWKWKINRRYIVSVLIRLALVFVSIFWEIGQRHAISFSLTA